MQSPKEVGDLLLEQGKLTEQQLEQVRRRQRRLNLPQHRAIVDLNFASEEDTWRALAAVNHLEFVDPVALDLKRETLELVPIKFIFHYRLLPVGGEEDDRLLLAFSEPPRQMEQGNLRLVLGKRFKSRPRHPQRHPRRHQEALRPRRRNHSKAPRRTRRRRNQPGNRLRRPGQGNRFRPRSHRLRVRRPDPAGSPAPQATDIHLEPYANSIRLRYRVDGILETVPVPADMRHLHSAVVSRLKIMAGLNIAEKRLPHDGRIAMKTGEEEYDLRVSIMPTKYGEAVCLRILGRQSLFLDLGQLGMEPNQEAVFAQLTRLAPGLVLLTGPTGSGKTTTLYAALAQANDEGRKIITFEDPIEYQLEGTVQIQVREQIGLTFATGLRSVLRHDPDVVLVGEIRDFETAEIAVRAAQTGHLVFSTLHTNDSISAVTRLLEMRIEPYLIASSLVCSISQRLARRICRHCAEDRPRHPRPSARGNGRRPAHPARARSRPGTAAAVSSAIRKATAAAWPSTNSSSSTKPSPTSSSPACKTGELRDAARKLGWRSLREMAWLKVQSGLIPISEQERWTRQLDPSVLSPQTSK